MSHSTTNPDEQALFDRALSDPDQLLLESLRTDERRRRRRRWMFGSLLLGGIVMSLTTMALLAGWLTVAAPPPVESQPPAAASTAHADENKAWVERLTGLRDHMHTAFGVGPDLTLLDPDQGIEIVRTAWPQITRSEVKTGLLKTFDFSKALPQTHPKLFLVLDLGMNDSDPEVREYAATYLEEYAGKEVARDPQKYAAWFKEHGEKDPAEVLKLQKEANIANAASGDAPPAIAPASSASDKISQASALTAEGWQLWQKQKFADAIPKFEQAVALDPEAVNAWNGLGWARFNSGNSTDAVTAFEKCVELEPNHPAALNGLGQIYLMWREFDQAKKFLTKAAPQAPAAWYGLARLYLLTGKYTAAERWINKALATSPNDETLKRMLAAAEAKELPDDLRRQIDVPGRPESSPSLDASAKGWQQFNAGDMRSAEKSFRAALAKDPENAAALNGLGFCLINQGNAAEAKVNFEKCLELEPNAAGAMNGLARCLKAEGNEDEAIAVWEKMRKAFPGPTAATVGLATTYLERGEKAKARPLFEELVKSMPDNAEFKAGLEAATN